MKTKIKHVIYLFIVLTTVLIGLLLVFIAQSISTLIIGTALFISGIFIYQKQFKGIEN